MAAPEVVLTERADGVRLAVVVSPRSSRSAVTGVREGALAVALHAPPVEGAANEELVALLARLCGVPKRAVRVVSGATGRRKLVDIAGVERATLAARLAGALP
ncbi:MAG: DUF167 domain-containing protein [Polyangiaceae bacterium]|nr:DUF167 domain-containing protein [Polyangiaceae bacterium]